MTTVPRRRTERLNAVNRDSGSRKSYTLFIQEVHTNPPKNLRARLEEKFVQAWESLTEGWRELLSRSSGALTRFDTPTKSRKGPQEDFPRWALLAAETWETAQSVIIRVELPGMKKEDLDISIHGNQLVIRAVKRSGGDHKGRVYHLMERAYGRFERTIHLPQDIDGTCVSCITSGSGRCQWRSSGLLKLFKGATRPRCW